MSYYAYDKLVLAPYALERILEFRIEKITGRHSQLYVKGIVKEADIDSFVELASEKQSISLGVVNENKEITLFTGLVQDIAIDAARNVRDIVITALGHTSAMDIVKRDRSFQNEAMPYEELITKITGEYSGVVMDMVSNGRPIGNFLLQYRETEWELISRFGTHFNAPLVPADRFGAVRYYFGVPKRQPTKTIQCSNYSVKNCIREGSLKSRNGLGGLADTDSIAYTYKSDDIFELGDSVLFNNRHCYVGHIVSVMKDCVLEHTYTLLSYEGLMVPKAYNKSAIGLSLFGKVTAIAKDTIKIALDIDASHPWVGSKWFAFSTVYSSPDGSGWYCMPEKGDRIRLICPTADETQAFSISSVNTEAGDARERSNPDHKTLHTIYGKRVNFTPNSVEIVANESTTVTLLDHSGIVVATDKKLTMEAKQGIEIKSQKGTVRMYGGKGIVLRQKKAQIVIEKDVTLSGKKIHLQK